MATLEIWTFDMLVSRSYLIVDGCVIKLEQVNVILFWLVGIAYLVQNTITSLLMLSNSQRWTIFISRPKWIIYVMFNMTGMNAGMHRKVAKNCSVTATPNGL